MATKKKVGFFFKKKQWIKRRFRLFLQEQFILLKRWAFLVISLSTCTLVFGGAYRYLKAEQTSSNVAIVQSVVDTPVSYVEFQNPISYTVVTETIPALDICDLFFISYKPSSYLQVVGPTERFLQAIKDYSCNDQKILTRIAHYESEFNFEAVNPYNHYATGLFQILPTTRDEECASKRGITNDFDCALFVIKNFYSWYDIAWPEEYNISFSELL